MSDSNTLNPERCRKISLIKVWVTGPSERAKTPVVYFKSYKYPRIEITIDEDFHTSLYELLETKYHIITAVSKEDIKADKADKKLAPFLKIEPVLERIRLVMDIGTKPVEYCYAYYGYDLFTYTIDIKRNL